MAQFKTQKFTFFASNTVIFSKNDIAVEDESVLYFKQWKPGELIIIEAYVESTGVEPALCIDKRDIVDAEISLLE